MTSFQLGQLLGTLASLLVGLANAFLVIKGLKFIIKKSKQSGSTNTERL